MIYRISSTSYSDGTVDWGIMQCDKDNYTLNKVEGNDYYGGIKIYITYVDTDRLRLHIGDDPIIKAFTHGKDMITIDQLKNGNYWHDELGKVRL